MLRVILEGTPASYPVEPFNASVPILWEAGQILGLGTDGNAIVWTTGLTVIGVAYDRRSANVGMSNMTFLNASVGNYGDESLFNQPGYGNNLFGTTSGVNNIIPSNTIPTTTLLRDETAVNPNSGSRFVTCFIRGGLYATDQFDANGTYTNAGISLFVNSSGLITSNSASGVNIGKSLSAGLDGNGLLTFQLTLV